MGDTSDTIDSNQYHPYCYEAKTEKEAEQNEIDDDVDDCSDIPFLGLDDELKFIALPEAEWSFLGKGNKVTVRDLFRLESKYNVTYDLKSISAEYPELRKECLVNFESEEFNVQNSWISKSIYSVTMYHISFVLVLLLIGIIFCVCSKHKTNYLKEKGIENLKYHQYGSTI